MLSRQAILDYQKAYKDTYGQELSYEKAAEGAIRLLRLFKLIYVPVPSDWLKKRRHSNEKYK